MKESQTKPASAESIARLADEGQDVTSYFTNKGKMMPAISQPTVRKKVKKDSARKGSRRSA
ncbi:MAG TPA: hypothetical protein VF397_12790 [Pyrinomonadaceae bacterium]